jgi:hypothetical protein
MWNLIKERVPFFSVPNFTLKDIYKELNIKDDSVLYDLGCGDGQVFFYLNKLILIGTNTSLRASYASINFEHKLL